MVYPDAGVHKDHGRSVFAPTHGCEIWFRAAEFCQRPGTFPFDQGSQPLSDKGGRFRQASDALSLVEQLIVDIECCAHGPSFDEVRLCAYATSTDAVRRAWFRRRRTLDRLRASEFPQIGDFSKLVQHLTPENESLTGQPASATSTAMPVIWD